MFIKHSDIIKTKENIILSVIITMMVMIFDLVLIENHPDFLGNSDDNNNNSEISEADFEISEEEIAKILNKNENSVYTNENFDGLIN